VIALSGKGECAVYTDRLLVVMPAVVELVPAVIGRGRHSSRFGHTCVSVAGIHLKNPYKRFPIKNVGNDAKDLF